MAKYRIKEFGKALPDFKEENFVASCAKANTEYGITIGNIDIKLSKEERERTIDTWDKIDKGELEGY